MLGVYSGWTDGGGRALLSVGSVLPFSGASNCWTRILGDLRGCKRCKKPATTDQPIPRVPFRKLITTFKLVECLFCLHGHHKLFRQILAKSLRCTRRAGVYKEPFLQNLWQMSIIPFVRSTGTPGLQFWWGMCWAGCCINTNKISACGPSTLQPNRQELLNSGNSSFNFTYRRSSWWCHTNACSDLSFREFYLKLFAKKSTKVF